ncbi:MAG TPA: hypothetical protein VHO25_19315 [Polyangiaceae bacterium]|nr:hypothetical protein [Polyangiaceae bacterium]
MTSKLWYAAPIFLRVILTGALVPVLPFSHLWFGEVYPDDGQEALGTIVIFFLVGVVASLVFLMLGSFAGLLLRKYPSGRTHLVDLALFAAFLTLLAYSGVTARYG